MKNRVRELSLGLAPDPSLSNPVTDSQNGTLEELKETEIKLQETVAALSEEQDLSSVLKNYHSVAESFKNMLKGLEELDKVKLTLVTALFRAINQTMALLGATKHSKVVTN